MTSGLHGGPGTIYKQNITDSWNSLTITSSTARTTTVVSNFSTTSGTIAWLMMEPGMTDYSFKVVTINANSGLAIYKNTTEDISLPRLILLNYFLFFFTISL